MTCSWRGAPYHDGIEVIEWSVATAGLLQSKPLAANPVRFVTRLTRLKPGGPIRPVLERSRWWA